MRPRRHAFRLAVFLLLCGGSAWAQDACDCRHVDALQAELRNALTLQSNFRKEIPHLRQFSEESSQMELKKFAAGRARRDVKTIPGYKGPDAVDYTPQGDFMGTTEGPAEKLCRMADSAAAQLNQAARATACVGIGESLRAHEAVHSRMCHRIGYAAYLRMHGADRAQEEVEAYGAQIAVLKGEIEKVLEKGEARVELEIDTRMQLQSNPLYSSLTFTHRGRAPLTRSSSSKDTIKLEGEGKQVHDAVFQGNCRFTKGMPYSLPVRVALETDGLAAKFSYTLSGTNPALTMRCEMDGHAFSNTMKPESVIPVAPLPVFELPLEKHSEKTFDDKLPQATQTGVTVTSKGKARLVFCEEKK